MKKNKQRSQNKRRQKKALETSRRQASKPSAQQHRELVKAFAKVRAQAARKMPDSFDETQHLFWMCHGTNFILSDFSKGTWNPLFDGIYEGRLPSPADVGRTIMTQYGPDASTWPPEAMQAMAWTMQPKATVYVYLQVALQKATLAKVKDPQTTILNPANTFTWETFDMLRTELTRKHVGEPSK